MYEFKGNPSQLPTQKIQIGIVVSQFNERVTNELYQGAIRQLQHYQINTDNILVAWVPGAIEIPITLKALLASNNLQGMIALGAVIQGKTQHFDYVCQQASDGIGQLSLETDVPISFGILTTQDQQQALERIGGNKGHKGEEAAISLLETIDVLHKINQF